MILILLFFGITVFYLVYVPIYLRRSNNIKPTKNNFDIFVDNDHGYPWSLDKKRIKSYKQALQNKRNIEKSKQSKI